MRRQHKKTVSGTALLLLFCGLLSLGHAEPIRNGNELALEYSTNTPAGKLLLQKNYIGKLLTFRYLKIEAIHQELPHPGSLTMLTREPSSAMQVAMVITTPLSLELAKTLSIDDCVAANGRLKSLEEETANLIELDPAILKYKDRASPKPTKELLRELDPTAH